MFAPDDVFKTDPLPHGYYWPSPMSNQQGIVLQPQKFTCPQEKIAPQKNAAASSQQLKDSLTNCERHSKIDLVSKENLKPTINAEVVSMNNASTSIDDLISDIDKNLAIDPNLVKPKADSKVSIDNILSVSNHSDTGMQVLSPSALRYYMERFKHSDPTHPLERSSGERPLSSESNKIEDLNLLKCVNDLSSNDSSYETITMNSSSFLERIVSSDDSTEWCFSNNLDEGNALNGSGSRSSLLDIKSTERAGPAEQKPMSFIEQLTGKTFSELSRIVPKEVICPADENEDILYQWRLKRHINEAKNSLPLDDDYVKAKKTSSPHNKNSLSDSEYSVKSPKSYCVSKEIQTDVEKRETGCQAMIIEDYSSRDSVPSKVGFKPKVLNTVHNLISDSCSDISISSDSSDDLTTISDLDEDHYESVFENKFESADLIKPGCFATNTPSQLACSDKLFKEVSPSCNENVSTPFGTQNAAPKVSDSLKFPDNTSPHCHDKMQEHQTSNDVFVRQNNVDELLSYLENIRSNLDDELLNIFIDRYQTVLTQMSEIEDEIKKHCNED